MDRRGFLITLGTAGVAACAGPARAAAPRPGDEPFAVLVDTTRCLGCRTCTVACAEAHGLPEPDMDAEVQVLSETQRTVVNAHQTSAGEVSVKRQCMACVQPACASACLTRAMHKTPEGPVEWREPKCMGCRFCMVSCPFEVPRFEYHSAVPRIVKCDMCVERTRAGKQPVCVENCPGEALTFGKRSALLALAHERIMKDPDQYVDHVYGEHEVGGTSWLYLAAAPFEELGFRTDLGETAYPMLTTGFLYGVPFVITLMPALLLALSNATRHEPVPVGEAAS